MNIIRSILKKSWQIFRRSGLIGLLQHRKDYYKSYPPLRKSLYYWLYSKLKIRKETMIRLNGFFMWLNLKDFGLSKQLWINGFREPECTKYFKAMLNFDDVVLDIGANIGYYVLMESRYTKEIYALEPLPENYKFLTSNIIINNIRNVTLSPDAVGNHKGQQSFFIGKKKNQANMFSGVNQTTVNCTTVDAFCKENNIKPTVIRMDIEGYEYYAINGMLKTLKKNNCKLFFEIHPYQMEQQGLDWERPLEKLFKLGYKITAIVKEHGPIREEIFYAGRKIDHLTFAHLIGITPETGYTHGFGLFMEKK